MIETRTTFSHDTDTPAVISWAEISNPNEQGYRKCNIAFGLGQGAIRTYQHNFGGTEWSAPSTDGVSIAGGLEVSLRPDMPMHHLRFANMRALWQPTAFRGLVGGNADTIFSGNFTRSEGAEREYFTSPQQTWQYLAEQFSRYNLSEYLPAIYYDINLSQASQLSREDQANIGPLAGSFETPLGHIHDVSTSERMAVGRAAEQLDTSAGLITQLDCFSKETPDDKDLRTYVNGVIKAIRMRAESPKDDSSVVLGILNYRPFHEFVYNADELITRTRHLSDVATALFTLEMAEARLLGLE